MNVRNTVCLTLGLACNQYASAQATALNVAFEQINQQTGSSTTALTFYAAEEQALLGGSGDPSSVSVARPNGTDDTLASFYTQLVFFSGNYSTLVAFNQDWSLGNYTFSGNSGSLNAVVSNNAPMWAQAPEVTNYSSLQGLSPVTGGEITLSPFVQDPGATSCSVAVYVYDLTQGDTLVADTSPSPITSIDLTPGMLQQSHQYSVNVEYLNVFTLPAASGFQGAIPSVSYNVVTNAGFYTTVPEPVPIAVMAIGLIGLAVRRTRTG